MALIKCPECSGKLSDRAPVCPHCGFPQNLLPVARPATDRQRRKRRKFPNGFGTVYKLSGNRANPWVAAKTFGWESNEEKMTSKQLQRSIGYFPTEADAIAALVAYNKNPYDIEKNTVTFSQAYELWSEDYYPTLKNDSSTRTYRAAYKYCQSIYTMRMRDLRVEHLEGVIRSCTAGDSTKARIKSMFNMIYAYCMKHEIVDKNYAALFSTAAAKPKIDRIPFTWTEIKKLWENIDMPYVDTVLFAIYSGCRPSEVFSLEVDNVCLKEGYVVGGIKTEAGIERVIPLHPDIIALFTKQYNVAVSNGWKYVFMNNEYNKGGYVHMTYDAYKGKFNRLMSSLDMKHFPADCRHTFITCAKERNMNDYLLKLIVGHAIEDVTEKTYTHRKIQQLCQAVASLDFRPVEIYDTTNSKFPC